MENNTEKGHTPTLLEALDKIALENGHATWSDVETFESNRTTLKFNL